MKKSQIVSNIVFGLHSTEALLRHSSQRIERLLLVKGRSDQRLQKLQQIATKHRIPISLTNRDEMDKLATNHQGIIAVITSPKPVYDERYLDIGLSKLTNPAFILVLDGVTDPQNLGACLRSAEAAGVDCVITPKNNSAGLTPAAVKVACGAAEIVPLITVTNLVRTLKKLQAEGIWILGAATEGDQYHYQANLSGPLALVMGAEGKGLRRLTRACCDSLIRIPLLGQVSSLNVSVATGICLFEAVRQRQLEPAQSK